MWFPCSDLHIGYLNILNYAITDTSLPNRCDQPYFRKTSILDLVNLGDKIKKKKTFIQLVHSALHRGDIKVCVRYNPYPQAA